MCTATANCATAVLRNRLPAQSPTYIEFVKLHNGNRYTVSSGLKPYGKYKKTSGVQKSVRYLSVAKKQMLPIFTMPFAPIGVLKINRSGCWMCVLGRILPKNTRLRVHKPFHCLTKSLPICSTIIKVLPTKGQKR